MTHLRLLYHLMLADFRERTRRYSFLVLLIVNFYLGYQVFVGNFTPRVGDYRGEVNCAWTGSTIAFTSLFMLLIFGFYLVKNAIARDYQTGVGQILATSPMRTMWYLVGKSLSNFAVLAAMVAAVAASAVAMQLVGSSTGDFNLWALLSPFLLLALPPLAFVASLATLFESIRWLRGGLGNVLFFIFIMTTLPLSSELNIPVLDLSGMKLLMDSLYAAVLTQYPGAKLNFILNPEYIANLQTFHWTGIDWNLAMILPRLFWVAAAGAVTLLSAIFFNRFDPSAEKQAKESRPAAASNGGNGKAAATPTAIRIAGLEPITVRFSFVSMIAAELRLSLKGFPKIWYLVAAGLLLAQLTAPLTVVRQYLMPAAWIWPILLWSSMGTRERRFNTGQVIFSSAYPMTRQLPAIWASGVVVALLTGGGAIIRTLAAGDMASLEALLIGALFVPTMALALGAVSGTSRLFETIYLVVWYIGPMNRMPALDYMGVTEAAVAQGMPTVYLLITILFGLLAILARRFRGASTG